MTWTGRSHCRWSSSRCDPNPAPLLSCSALTIRTPVAPDSCGVNRRSMHTRTVAGYGSALGELLGFALVWRPRRGWRGSGRWRRTRGSRGASSSWRRMPASHGACRGRRRVPPPARLPRALLERLLELHNGALGSSSWRRMPASHGACRGRRRVPPPARFPRALLHRLLELHQRREQATARAAAHGSLARACLPIPKTLVLSPKNRIPVVRRGVGAHSWILRALDGRNSSHLVASGVV